MEPAISNAAAATTPQRLPFFVYGTLLPGQPNFYLWGDAIIHSQPATLRGGRLYDLGQCPMLIEAREGEVRGLAVRVRPEHYAAILAQLDALEGFDLSRPHETVYERVARRVYRPNGKPLNAWVYVGRQQWVQGLTPLPDGDWGRYSASRLADMAQWWATFGRELPDQPASFWTTFL